MPYNNTCIFIGRIGSIETRYSQNGTCTTKYSIAVDRVFKRDGEPDTDWIRCIAFGKSGEWAEKYLKKGIKVAVKTHVQNGSYTNKDGQTVYTTDYIIDEQGFAESKSASQQNVNEPLPSQDNAPTDMPAPSQLTTEDFMKISDLDTSELPFD